MILIRRLRRKEGKCFPCGEGTSLPSAEVSAFLFGRGPEGCADRDRKEPEDDFEREDWGDFDPAGGEHLEGGKGEDGGQAVVEEA